MRFLACKTLRTKKKKKKKVLGSNAYIYIPYKYSTRLNSKRVSKTFYTVLFFTVKLWGGPVI